MKVRHLRLIKSKTLAIARENIGRKKIRRIMRLEARNRMK